MGRLRIVVLSLVVLCAIVLPARGAGAFGSESPTVQAWMDWGCADTAAWWDELGGTFDNGLIVSPGIFRDMYASADQLEEAKIELLIVRHDLSQMSVPRAAREFHDAHVAMIDLVISIVDARQDGDLERARAADTVQAWYDIDTALRDGYSAGLRRCGDTFYQAVFGV